MTGFEYLKRLLEARAATQLELARLEVEAFNLEKLCDTIYELYVDDPDADSNLLIKQFESGCVDLTDSLRRIANHYNYTSRTSTKTRSELREMDNEILKHCDGCETPDDCKDCPISDTIQAVQSRQAADEKRRAEEDKK